MSVKRIVANIAAPDLAKTRSFYAALFGLEVLMDHGWIVSLGAGASAAVQFNLASAAYLHKTLPPAADFYAVKSASGIPDAELGLPLLSNRLAARQPRYAHPKAKRPLRQPAANDGFELKLSTLQAERMSVNGSLRLHRPNQAKWLTSVKM